MQPKSGTLGRPVATPRATGGFTLIEVLIVLAIVGILAAILLPVLARTREAARIATCSSNLKQLSLALNQYVQDSGGFYPNVSSQSPDKRLPPNCGWAIRIVPYVKDRKVFLCPSLPAGEYRDGCPPDTPSQNGSEYSDGWDGSYDLTQGRAAVNNSGMVSQVRIRRPSEWPLAFDGRGSESEWHNYNVHSRLKLGYARHRGGLNVLFFDGHVKWLPLDSLVQERNWK